MVPRLPAGLTEGGAELKVLRSIIENLCARMCHDFSGILGTLLGALECAADPQDDGPGEAAGLAHEAAEAMVFRLRLLRAAWGGPDAELTPGAIFELLAGLTGRARLVIDLSGLPPARLPAATGRALLNLLMLAAEALPAGGRIAAGGDREIVISIAGPRAAWPPEFTACLHDPAQIVAQLSRARRSQGALAALIAQGAEQSLRFAAGAPGVPAALLMGPSPDSDIRPIAISA